MKEENLLRRLERPESLADAILDTDTYNEIDDQFARSILIPSPIPEYDHYYGQNPERHMIRYVYHVNRDALVQDLFERLSRR